MAEEINPGNPDRASELTQDLAELTITPIPNTQPQKINIPILQPLARSPMFNACRNPDSRIIRMQDGRKGGVTEDEILNIKPLGLKWRQALRRLTLPSGPFVLIFDLTLPQRTDTIEHNSEERTSQTLYWDTGTPAEGGFGVPTHDLRILVVTLAIAVKMRAGSLCDFEVSARKEEGLMPKAYNDMISHLAKLSKYRRKSDGDALS